MVSENSTTTINAASISNMTALSLRRTAFEMCIIPLAGISFFSDNYKRLYTMVGADVSIRTLSFHRA
jgi:hypothetical protein